MYYLELPLGVEGAGQASQGKPMPEDVSHIFRVSGGKIDFK